MINLTCGQELDLEVVPHMEKVVGAVAAVLAVVVAEAKGGVYPKPYQGRGTIHEWHGALGYAPNTYSAKGLANALPVDYGRFLSGQMVAGGY